MKSLILVGLIVFSSAYASDECKKYLAGSPEWKLIRDRLPEIFVAENDPTIVDQVTDPEEIKRLLIRKLKEEVQELERNPTPEEMGDIQETLNALAARLGFSVEEISNTQEAKRERKGGFEKGFVMKINPDKKGTN